MRLFARVAMAEELDNRLAFTDGERVAFGPWWFEQQATANYHVRRATNEQCGRQGTVLDLREAIEHQGSRLTHVESAPPAATIESTKTCGPQQGAALMKRTTKYVAFDVHQATTVASVREESGRVIARSVLPTDSGALTEFVRGMRGARHVTFEEGTQAQWLYELLAPLVDRVIVCDRRGAPRQGNKGDQVDADHLSELLRRGALRAVYHGSADRATLKELTRTYRNLVEDATRVMLRLKALFRARGIATAGTAVYHPRHRARWLAQLLEGGARFRAEALYAELDVLRQLRPKAKAVMVTEARQDPAWRVLRTIPFLGPVRVALLLATMQTPWRFRTKRQLWAYAELA